MTNDIEKSLCHSCVCVCVCVEQEHTHSHASMCGVQKFDNSNILFSCFSLLLFETSFLRAQGYGQTRVFSTALSGTVHPSQQGGSFQLSLSCIPVSYTKVCSLFSDSFLPFSSAGKLRAMAITCVHLGTSETSPHACVFCVLRTRPRFCACKLPTSLTEPILKCLFLF